jgi:hypothetical protein
MRRMENPSRCIAPRKMMTKRTGFENQMLAKRRLASNGGQPSILTRRGIWKLYMDAESVAVNTVRLALRRPPNVLPELNLIRRLSLKNSAVISELIQFLTTTGTLFEKVVDQIMNRLPFTVVKDP